MNISTTITIKNQTRRMQVYNLPHDIYCAATGHCTCETVEVITVVENPITGDRSPRTVTKYLPASVTLLAGAHWPGQPGDVLRIPEIQRAVARGTLRVITKAAARAAAQAKRKPRRAAAPALNEGASADE